LSKTPEELTRERDEARLLVAKLGFSAERFITRYTSRAKRESEDGKRMFAMFEEIFETVTEWKDSTQ
jgi:hypothetical protein